MTQPFAPNDAIAKLGATEGGQSRIAVLDIPGSELGVDELAEVANPPPGSPEGNVLGAGFEPAIANSEASVRFYNELLGFSFQLGAGFNDNQVMAATAGVPGASFRQSRSLIPGTSVTYTFIEWQNADGQLLSGRTQDPGTTILQLRVRDVTALTAKLKAAGVPVVTTGGAPVEVLPGLKISIVRDPSNVLLELVESTRR
jgi:catechol 2,3-dioxygenase-like lactoylglutathione lyase family enzyme